MAVQLPLCLCIVTVIQLTASQSTYDDVSSCSGRTEHLLSQLVTSVSQIQTAISQQNNNVTEQLMGQLVTSVSQIQTAISQQNSNVTEQLMGQLVTISKQNNNVTEQLIGQLVTSVSRMETAISQQNNNVTEQLMGQLVTAVSRMETAISQLVTTVSQLQSDVAELKAGNRQDVAGIPEFRWKFNIRLSRHIVETSVLQLSIIRLKLRSFPQQRRIGWSVPSTLFCQLSTPVRYCSITELVPSLDEVADYST